MGFLFDGDFARAPWKSSDLGVLGKERFCK